MIIYKHYGNAEGESYDEAVSELDVAGAYRTDVGIMRVSSGGREDVIMSHHRLGSKRERTPRQVRRPGTQRFRE